ncbi:VWA domain-containing protein [bacterium]|nr:VWA domain-containing protein [candidate division CSSED10-310 bacterium]
MRIGINKWLLVSLAAVLCGSAATAQTPTPPYIGIEKQMTTLGEICPGGYIDISIRLTGAGTTAFLRNPINAVCVIDKSGSMGANPYGYDVAWNESAEPPYAPVGTYPLTRRNPYVATVWAAWNFYKYFIDNQPSLGHDDFGGLVYYSNGSAIPGYSNGVYAVTTPTTIQRVRDNPVSVAHKNFWWHSKLAREYPPQGGTAIGPAMQYARNLINVMPLHVPSYFPGTPTPITPKPTIDGENFMILLTDGQPNDYWTPGPSEVPGWSSNAYVHAIEMAKRCSLGSPWGSYSQVFDTTIFTIGLGSQVDTSLLSILADPWNWAYMNGTPTPTDANHGFFSWALTEDDLVDAFEAIAGTIVSNLAGTDIYVFEMVPAVDAMCPGGATVFTQIDPASVNPPPTIIPPATPGGNPVYTWNFQELYIGDELEITFRMEIPMAAPTGVFSLIECPESQISYTNYQGISETTPIFDPGFMMGVCGGPTDTPTPTPTPTLTPTCIQEVLFFDDFESGDFSLWESSGPTWGLQAHLNNALAFSGNYFAYFAGSENPVGFGFNEASMLKIIDFSSPVRPGAVLEFYVRLKGFSFPQMLDKSGFDDPNEYDLFIAEVSDGNGHFTYVPLDYSDVKDDYFHVRMSLMDFAGSMAVRIRLLSYFPVTVFNPDPSSNEPMVFIDDVMVFDYCYDNTPTPTPTQPQGPIIPATSRNGLGIIILAITMLIGVPLIRRTH